jgi:hypothetical protein
MPTFLPVRFFLKKEAVLIGAAEHAVTKGRKRWLKLTNI